MRLFYKKKTVKPTEKELSKITTRLMAKYPQMYESAYNGAERRVIESAPVDVRQGLEKMVGKRLKRRYRS